jgi:hypothetical protein
MPPRSRCSMRTLTTHEPSGATACHRLCGGQSRAQDLTIRKPQRLDLDRPTMPAPPAAATRWIETETSEVIWLGGSRAGLRSVSGASRARTGDLLGAITPQSRSLALVRLVQALSGAVSSARFSQFGSTVGSTACLPRNEGGFTSLPGHSLPAAPANCAANRRTRGSLHSARTGAKIERGSPRKEER